MKKGKTIKVIFDTNIWISYLIGKQVQNLSSFISDKRVTIVFSEQLLRELEIVTRRPRLQRYFRASKVSELINLIKFIGKKYPVNNLSKICRDPKDDFLLELSRKSKADYLVTGDKDLLDLKAFCVAKIVTPSQFDREFLLPDY